MSEQTTDTHNSASDGQDPSMEDILASIRKIIAEDDAPTNATSDTAAVETSHHMKGDVAELAKTDTLDLDIVEEVSFEASKPTEANFNSNVDALIGDMDPQGRTDLDIPELELPVSEDTALGYEGGSNDVLDLLIPMEEDESEAEQAIALEAPEIVTAKDEIDELLGDLVTEDEPIVDMLEIEPPEDDLSTLLDNMLEDSSSFAEAEAPIVQESVIDPAADLLADTDDDVMAALDFSENDDFTEVETSSDSGGSNVDPDMMLVKSLMADLTEEPLHEAEAPVETGVEAPVETAPPLEFDTEEPEDETTNDVLDEILSVTLDDETQLSEEILSPEVEAEFTEPEQAEDVATQTETGPAALSLKDIAAQAEADAQSADAGLIAAVAGVGAVGAAAVLTTASEDEELAVEDDAEETPDDVETAISGLNELLDAETELSEDLTLDHPNTTDTESTIEETPDMARAKKSDAIIDEVTESATAGAFASLTSVVEEKATVAERGDRIGDLVMEALQPMLKEWLDANLKGIVERAVTKEVKRISSGK